MANKIQVKRGLQASLPTLDVGEPALTTNSGAEKVYIGTGTGNKEIPTLVGGTLPIVKGGTGTTTVAGIKTALALGNVLDYGVATQAEAEAGVVNNKYMTPQRVLESIKENGGWDTIAIVDITSDTLAINIPVPTGYTHLILEGSDLGQNTSASSVLVSLGFNGSTTVADYVGYNDLIRIANLASSTNYNNGARTTFIARISNLLNTHKICESTSGFALPAGATPTLYEYLGWWKPNAQITMLNIKTPYAMKSGGKFILRGFK